MKLRDLVITYDIKTDITNILEYLDAKKLDEPILIKNPVYYDDDSDYAKENPIINAYLKFLKTYYLKTSNIKDSEKMMDMMSNETTIESAKNDEKLNEIINKYKDIQI